LGGHVDDAQMHIVEVAAGEDELDDGRRRGRTMLDGEGELIAMAPEIEERIDEGVEVSRATQTLARLRTG
jgi:hypothetical protein